MTRILLIDDSAAVRGALRALLTDTFPGALVREAPAAEPALVAIGREPWDLVLLDLSLPDRAGVDVLREIRRRDATLPIVVMSLHPEQTYRAAMRASGATDYVSKASPAAAIAAVVRRALAKL